MAAGLGAAACLEAPGGAGDVTITEPSAQFAVTVVAEGLAYPWSLAFLPGGDMLVTERDGRLRLIRDGILQPEPIAGVPEAFVASQGGLFDVVLDPDFPRNRLIYLTYAWGGPDANATRVVRAVFDGRSLSNVEVLFTASPTKDTAVHYGGRLAFRPDGTFLLTLGEGFEYREESQRLSSHLGTIVRLNADGSVPADNPFVDDDDALPEIWSYGHRNVQGLVYDGATGRMWEHEHGPRGGDELNLIEPGTNYGWPVVTHGIDYSGARITPYSTLEGYADSVTWWVPSIAPSGMAIYHGALFPQWEGDLFVTALAAGEMRRLDLNAAGEVVGQEALLADREQRLRDVRVGPDGALYVLTDSPEGQVLRLAPQQ